MSQPMEISHAQETPEGSIAQDLESYISNYTGHTKLYRLKYIAEHCPSLSVRQDAFRLAIEEAKRGHNTEIYAKLVEAYGACEKDETWISSVDKRATLQQQKLEADLNVYKSNLVKESIRMGHNDLGDFFYERGDLNGALKAYIRTRDYCTTTKHILAMCLNVIKVGIEMKNFVNVATYVTKAEQLTDAVDKVVMSKLSVASGLSHLDSKRYKLAGRKFLETTIDLGTEFNSVIAPMDIAALATLCALATFDRHELKAKVIENPAFKDYLELFPDVRELANAFYNSRYAVCLKYLATIKPDMLLDIYLAPHVEELYNMIRNKALIQYFSPFLSVNMHNMAAAFNTDVLSLEKELAVLIMDNQIKAKIDSHNKILYARHADQRNDMYESALHVAQDYLDNSKAMLLRVSIMRHGLDQVHHGHMRISSQIGMALGMGMGMGMTNTQPMNVNMSMLESMLQMQQ
eukprot:TRINITY_DN2398_c0_g1::TRINITY_DN2398_c0_g1_i1::g.20633::m.20633 TRINITY_DN2398_c0_g1::TRINITY_DN2398_c0_g1_i1::g.20633  ORF type:complete len:482 (-),score=118.26,sp/P45432/CSN1_ARATH/54.00/9e-147,RPN7/PF10602.4/3.8e-54,RPN7/PF10602.4/3.9e+03,PCI/PF01399.22/2.7e-15,Crust_neurohorm/PF01147.12/1.3,Crust_neurohorm/PF01147.12/1.3e+03,Crust_neurohorm/PF01147.12/1.4e+02 TRINITY_DN2398_c0_g1_i1:136-1518(-)